MRWFGVSRAVDGARRGSLGDDGKFLDGVPKFAKPGGDAYEYSDSTHQPPNRLVRDGKQLLER
jgi:hypothetical protein